LAVDGSLHYDLSPIEVQRKLKGLLDRVVRSGDSKEKIAAGEVSIGSTFNAGEEVFVER
jgi:diadenylate cyclase